MCAVLCVLLFLLHSRTLYMCVLRPHLIVIFVNSVRVLLWLGLIRVTRRMRLICPHDKLYVEKVPAPRTSSAGEEKHKVLAVRQGVHWSNRLERKYICSGSNRRVRVLHGRRANPSSYMAP